MASECATLAGYTGIKERPPVPWKKLFARMAPVTAVYFCYGWVLWLFLGWIPQYFLHSYHMHLAQSALFASGVFFAGVLGDVEVLGVGQAVEVRPQEGDALVGDELNRFVTVRESVNIVERLEVVEIEVEDAERLERVQPSP